MSASGGGQRDSKSFSKSSVWCILRKNECSGHLSYNGLDFTRKHLEGPAHQNPIFSQMKPKYTCTRIMGMIQDISQSVRHLLSNMVDRVSCHGHVWLQTEAEGCTDTDSRCKWITTQRKLQKQENKWDILQWSVTWSQLNRAAFQWMQKEAPTATKNCLFPTN